MNTRSQSNLQDAARRRLLSSGMALAVGGCSDAGTGATAAPPVPAPHRLSTVGAGWARTSVNAPIFRKDALTSDAVEQYAAWYDDDAQVIVARRRLDDDAWTSQATGFSGRPRDAHNSISLMLDGDGYLHLAWDHHDDPLHYARSVAPGGLVFSPPEPMLGTEEDRVTYPEFLALPCGDLLFAYRHGRSGDGVLVLDRYAIATRTWSRVQDALLDGQGERSAYWQLHADAAGTVHLSWLWRDSEDVTSNHDLHYARSTTGGASWSDVRDVPATLPITASNAPPILAVPPGRNLINQTSLTADPEGAPAIAFYFRPAEGAITDIHVLSLESGTDAWRLERVSRRGSDFELTGPGTKSLPLSRPQIVHETRGRQRWLHVVYRDAEQDDRAVLASSERTVPAPTWTRSVLPGGPLDRWEPSFDSRLWRDHARLHLYLQRVGQVDREGVDEDYPPTPVRVLEVTLPAPRAVTLP